MSEVAPCATGEVERLRETLRWYAEQVADCRKITPAGDQARRLLDADGGVKARAALSPQGLDAKEGERLTIKQAWDELLNVDDRTSPEEYPDMCLITRDELADFMERATPSQRLDAATVEREGLIGLEEAARDLLDLYRADQRTVGYRVDRWDCLAAILEGRS